MTTSSSFYDSKMVPVKLEEPDDLLASYLNMDCLMDPMDDTALSTLDSVSSGSPLSTPSEESSPSPIDRKSPVYLSCTSAAPAPPHASMPGAIPSMYPFMWPLPLFLDQQLRSLASAAAAHDQTVSPSSTSISCASATPSTSALKPILPALPIQSRDASPSAANGSSVLMDASSTTHAAAATAAAAAAMATTNPASSGSSSSSSMPSATNISASSATGPAARYLARETKPYHGSGTANIALAAAKPSPIATKDTKTNIKTESKAVVAPNNTALATARDSNAHRKKTAMDLNQKRQERLIKNRAAALLSRKRKREQLQSLEQERLGLLQENEALKEQVQQLGSKIQSMEMEWNELQSQQKQKKQPPATMEGDDTANMTNTLMVLLVALALLLLPLWQPYFVKSSSSQSSSSSSSSNSSSSSSSSAHATPEPPASASCSFSLLESRSDAALPLGKRNKTTSHAFPPSQHIQHPVVPSLPPVSVPSLGKRKQHPL